MGRLYMSYINEGKQGNTWATIVALILGAENRWMTTREIADVVWGDPMTTPLDLRQTINSNIDKLVRAGFIDYMQAPKDSLSSYLYILNSAGMKQFEPKPGYKASEHSDSKLFTRDNLPARRKSKKIIRFNKKRHYQRRTA